MESLGIVQTHVIYRSERNDLYFYQDEFVGVDGVTRFFYCLGDNFWTYSLPDAHGRNLHNFLNQTFRTFGSEGVEVELIRMSSVLQKEFTH